MVWNSWVEKQKTWWKHRALCNIVRNSSTVMNSAGKPIEQSDTVTRFMKGIFHANPPTPKYDIWGPEKILSCLNNLEKNNKLQNVNIKKYNSDCFSDKKKGTRDYFIILKGLFFFRPRLVLVCSSSVLKSEGDKNIQLNLNPLKIFIWVLSVQFWTKLTHLFPMHPFSTPWKRCLQWVQNGCIGTEWVEKTEDLTETWAWLIYNGCWSP